jgi:hypothetical protein
MKKSLLIFTIFTSMLSVVNISQASANCTAEDPCATWAMLDTQGTVTNTIVCQASVCGGGTWAGQTVVPQVAANPVTNDTTGTGGFNSSQDKTELVTHSDGKFIVTENTTVYRDIIEIIPNSDQAGIENNTTIQSSVLIPISSKSFTYEDTINKLFSEIIFYPETFDESKPTTISVEKKNKDLEEFQKIEIYERTTQSELQLKLESQQLTIIIQKFQTILTLLDNWIK